MKITITGAIANDYLVKVPWSDRLWLLGKQYMVFEDWPLERIDRELKAGNIEDISIDLCARNDSISETGWRSYLEPVLRPAPSFAYRAIGGFLMADEFPSQVFHAHDWTSGAWLPARFMDPTILARLRAKEVPPVHSLYSVTMIDNSGAILIDTKVVAKSEEAAKLAAGVYGWLHRHEHSFEDVTVILKNLGAVNVKEAAA